MSQPHEIASSGWLGPLGAWLANVAVWATAGMSPLAALGALAALWWTVERALAERARRRTEEARTQVYAEYVDEARKTRGFRRMMDRLTTRRGDL